MLTSDPFAENPASTSPGAMQDYDAKTGEWDMGKAPAYHIVD